MSSLPTNIVNEFKSFLKILVPNVTLLRTKVSNKNLNLEVKVEHVEKEKWSLNLDGKLKKNRSQCENRTCERIKIKSKKL